jgi:hypothetical protein
MLVILDWLALCTTHTDHQPIRGSFELDIEYQLQLTARVGA